MLVASPALRLAPPAMQLWQADSVSASVGTAGFAAGRALPMMAVESPVKFTGNAVATSSVTALSGNAMEDMWEKSRGRPLRRSLALWLFSMKATWKIIRAHKSEAKQIKVAAWVRQHAQRVLALPQLASYAWCLWAACTPRGTERPAHRAPRHTSGARAAASKVADSSAFGHPGAGRAAPPRAYDDQARPGRLGAHRPPLAAVHRRPRRAAGLGAPHTPL